MSNTKATLAAVLFLSSALSSALHAQKTTFQSEPVSEKDLVQILELRVQKERITFGKPKYVTLRFESPGYKKDFSLPDPTSQVVLLTHIPDGGRSLRFWITDENRRSIYSYFSIDFSKVKTTESGLKDGVYTITSYGEEKEKEPLYRLQVLTSDEKP